MEFRHTLEILHNQAEEISIITDRLRSDKEIRKIEIDLLLEKLRNIYDLVKDLGEVAVPLAIHMSEEQPVPELKAESPEEVKAPEVKSPKPVLEDTHIHKAGVHKEENKEMPSLSDRFKTSGRNIAEDLSDKAKSSDISLKLKSKPISNIAGAIGLAEKFELINELFDGDKGSFEKTIEILDMAQSFEEAQAYLEENFSWDMDSMLVQHILDLIKRKLIVHRP
jgi:hypothetical protein